MNCNEYLRGQRDCKDGVEHKAEQSEDYDRGYGDQYSAEQVADWANLEMGLEVDCGAK